MPRELSSYDPDASCPAPGLCLGLSDRIVKLETKEFDRATNTKYMFGLLGSVLTLCFLNLGVLLLWVGKVDGFLTNTAALDLTQGQAIHQIERDLYSLPEYKK